MRTKRVFLLFAALMLLVTSAVSTAQEDEVWLNIAWPYTVPPTGHFNTFSANGFVLSIYQDFSNPALAILKWGEGSYEGLLAESFGWTDDGNYQVTIKSGYSWSDGTPITAADVVATFNLFRLRGDVVWQAVTGVEQVDDTTILFTLDEPSTLAERRILTSQVRPYSTYGDLADRAAAAFAAGEDTADLLTELTEFRPESLVSGGPFVMDIDSITEANLTYSHNPGGFGGDTTAFNRVRLWNGETDTVTPLVANGDLWYITHGIPPTTEQAFIDAGIDIIRAPMGTGPALYFNHRIAALSRVEVRQAIAYAIDRDQNGFVSLGNSGVASEYMTGIGDSLAESWLSDDVLGGLNSYGLDMSRDEALAEATALLEGIGYTKGADGVWLDDAGAPLAFELIFPQEFADWSAAAENATQQLNDFGFNITARGVPFQQQLEEVLAGNFEIAVRNWGVGDPIPAVNWLEPYNRYNGQGELAGEQGAGMGFNDDVSYSGGEINLFDVTIASSEGTDRDAQAGLVAELAVSFNEILPIVPLWERYTNNALNRQFLNAPPSDDPIYLNQTGLDAFMPYLVITGGVTPAE